MGIYGLLGRLYLLGVGDDALDHLHALWEESRLHDALRVDHTILRDTLVMCATHAGSAKEVRRVIVWLVPVAQGWNWKTRGRAFY